MFKLYESVAILGVWYHNVTRASAVELVCIACVIYPLVGSLQ